jgi:hypothetical protein
MTTGAREADREQLRLTVAQALCYHDRRRAFFEAFGKSLEFLALVGSAGTILALLEVDTKAAALVLSAVAAGAILLNILLAPAAKLGLHTALRNRLLDLQARLDAHDLTAADIGRLAQAHIEIEKDAPPVSSWPSGSAVTKR